MFINMRKRKFDQLFLPFPAKKKFVGKSRVCQMTEISGAADNLSDFDNNTILLEREESEYVYICGLEILEFKTDDKIIDYISLFMGNNKTAYTFAFGETYIFFYILEKYIIFLSTAYKYIENDKIEKELY